VFLILIDCDRTKRDIIDGVERMPDGAELVLLTGMALVISSVIQALTYGLLVYHGLIMLALSLVTLAAAIPPYVTLLIGWRTVDSEPGLLVYAR
jgi:hypothetical protein